MNAFGRVALKITQISGAIFMLSMLSILTWMPASAATNSQVGNGTPGSCTEAAFETALAAGDDVTFNCGAAPHTITLTSVKDLTADVLIDGGGKITLSGGNNQGIFEINDANINVTLRRLTLIDAPGKAIYNEGVLTVVQSTFRNNPGGAIYSAGGATIVINSTFEDNKAVAGGAITNENAGTLTVSGSTFTNNSTTGSNDGGAIFGSTASKNTIINSTFEGNKALTGSAGAISNSGTMTIELTTIRNNIAAGGGGIKNNGDLTITDSRVTSNTATSSGGGGITHFNQSAAASHITVIRTTIDHNLAQQGGGGLWFSGPEATLEATNSTFYSNTATTIGGGGLLVDSGDATLTNVTFNDNNSVATAGDNLENYAVDPGTVNVRNSLVVIGGCAGTIGDGDGNLEFPGTSCGFDTPSADPGLGALAANGGWAPTIAISETGPAKNTGINANCPATDQRGVLRPQFNTCDIGAFEWGAKPVLDSIAPTSTLALSPTFTLVVNGSNFIPGSPASLVLWDGTAIPTTYVSGTELRATVDASLIVAGALVSITVETPVIDGDVSDNTEIFTIFKRDQTIDFAELADRGPAPATFNVNATASSGLAVSFNATGVCTVAGNTVTLSGDFGTCTITAQQAGNVSYNAAPNVVRSFDVVKQDQTINFAELADRGLEPATFTISATATSGLAVTFTASGVCTVAGTTVTLTGEGTCTITAHQAGNESYNAAPDVAHSFEVSDAQFMRIPLIFGKNE